MYHGIVNVPFWISMDYVIDDGHQVTKSVRILNCTNSVNI